ncbi:MAG TPA: hypothetical protein VF589_12605 [Allosphingosinicella sp.]|jgi:Ca2+-binding RTX toxin-like protein
MAFIKGTNLSENVNGTDDDDYILGLGGNDAANGGQGADNVYAGEGADTLYDLVDGGAGDALYGEGGDDNFWMFDGEADIIDGGYGSDLYLTFGGTSVVIDLMNQDLNAGIAAGDRLRSIERFLGGTANDTFRGSTRNEDFIDSQGDDFYNGRGGIDIYRSGNPMGAADAVDFEVAYGNRAEELAALKGITLSSPQAGVAAYTIWNDANNDTVRDADEVTYQVDELVGIEHYIGLYANSVMTGSAVNEVFYCNSAITSVDGAGGANDFVAYGGLATSSAVTIDLEAGTAESFLAMGTLSRIESVVGSANGDEIRGSTLANTLVGLTGDDALDGCGGNDRLDGGAGIDLLVGRNGNDILMGGALGDTIDGGVGSDTVCYTSATAAVTVTIATGATGGGEGDGDWFVSVENVIGSTFDDYVYGNGFANRIEGREGDDRLAGGAGNDRIYGDFDPASAVAAGTASFDPAAVIGDSNSVEPGPVPDDSNQLYGQAGNDLLFGGSASDNLYGGSGNDRLDGGTGSNNLYGGTGNDTYVIDYDNNYFTELAGQGTDVVLSSVSTYLRQHVENAVATGAGAIMIEGNDLDNMITGNNAANELEGSGGSDSLIGGGGNDFLDGEYDSDTLTGGGGKDTFAFQDDIREGGVDNITDFVAADDTILLSRNYFGGIMTEGRLSASAFRLGTEAADASDRIMYDQGTGRIFYDADGAGGSQAAVLFATVDAGTTLTAADFLTIQGYWD